MLSRRGRTGQQIWTAGLCPCSPVRRPIGGEPCLPDIRPVKEVTNGAFKDSWERGENYYVQTFPPPFFFFFLLFLLTFSTSYFQLTVCCQCCLRLFNHGFLSVGHIQVWRLTHTDNNILCRREVWSIRAPSPFFFLSSCKSLWQCNTKTLLWNKTLEGIILAVNLKDHTCLLFACFSP